MIFTWAFLGFHDILGLGKYGFSGSANELFQSHAIPEGS